MKKKLPLLKLILLALPILMSLQVVKTSILDAKVNMIVHSAETLESVIFRLQTQTGEPIGYTSTMLMPYKAKAADYKDITIREILSQQLASTPIIYRIKRRQLVLYPEIVKKK